MTKFLDKSFSSRPASDAYRDNWDATFGKKRELRCAFVYPNHIVCDAGPEPHLDGRLSHRFMNSHPFPQEGEERRRTVHEYVGPHGGDLYGHLVRCAECGNVEDHPLHISIKD